MKSTAQADDTRRSNVNGNTTPGTPLIDAAKAQDLRNARLARLKDSLTERAYLAVERTPPKYQGMRIKAHLGELSPRLAIKAKCEECVGYEDVREEVGNCKAMSCPIWTYRPYQTIANDK